MTYLSKVNECPPPAVQKAAITASVGGSGGTFKLAVESFTRLPLLEQMTVAYFKLLIDEEARLQAATAYETGFAAVAQVPSASQAAAAAAGHTQQRPGSRLTAVYSTTHGG